MIDAQQITCTESVYFAKFRHIDRYTHKKKITGIMKISITDKFAHVPFNLTCPFSTPNLFSVTAD